MSRSKRARKQRQAPTLTDDTSEQKACKALNEDAERLPSERTREPRDLLSRLWAERNRKDPDHERYAARLRAAIARARARPVSDEERMYWEVREKVHVARILKEEDWPPRLSQDDKNLFRWEAVHKARFRDRLSWSNAYQAASKRFTDTDCAGRPATMKWSYDQVQRIRKSTLKIPF
jgi:hypothetical protein